jgi:hypothetical protein
MQKEKWKTMDVILVILAIFLLVFVIVMIAIYIRTGGIPDTLCTCVSPYMALKSMTDWAAYQYFEDEHKGTIT